MTQTKVRPRNSVALAKPKRTLNRLIEGLPYETYAQAEGINNSGLLQLLRSPAHYRHWTRAPARAPTPALELGKITHLCVLEPDLYDKSVVVAPEFAVAKGHTLKAQREAWEGALPNGAIIVSAKQHDKARAMRDAVWANPDARKLLAKGKREASLWWDDPVFKVRCKARVDFVSQVVDRGLILDLKTTTDASRLKFARSMADYRYDMQAAHYLEGGRASGAFDADHFFFLAVESEAPHATVLYSISDVVRGVGSQWRDEAMARYRQAVDNNAWPSLPTSDEIGLLKWVKVPGEEDETIS